MRDSQQSVPATVELQRLETACRDLIQSRFGGTRDYGAAAVLLSNGSIITGTSPEFPNPSTTLCHETEPYLAAFRLAQPILASLCLHRTEDDRFIVLSPCGICRERLMMYGPATLIGVPATDNAVQIQWVRLDDALPFYWRAVSD